MSQSALGSGLPSSSAFGSFGLLACSMRRRAATAAAASRYASRHGTIVRCEAERDRQVALGSRDVELHLPLEARRFEQPFGPARDRAWRQARSPRAIARKPSEAPTMSPSAARQRPSSARASTARSADAGIWRTRAIAAASREVVRRAASRDRPAHRDRPGRAARRAESRVRAATRAVRAAGIHHRTRETRGGRRVVRHVAQRALELLARITHEARLRADAVPRGDRPRAAPAHQSLPPPDAPRRQAHPRRRRARAAHRAVPSADATNPEREPRPGRAPKACAAAWARARPAAPRAAPRAARTARRSAATEIVCRAASRSPTLANSSAATAPPRVAGMLSTTIPSAASARPPTHTSISAIKRTSSG